MTKKKTDQSGTFEDLAATGMMVVVALVAYRVFLPAWAITSMIASQWLWILSAIAAVVTILVLWAAVSAWLSSDTLTDGDSPAVGDVGVLVVHGIGNQARGTTCDEFSHALQRYAPELTADPTNEKSFLTGKRRIRVYEVYWADALPAASVKGSFRSSDLLTFAWFGWLNRRSGSGGWLQWCGAFVRTSVLVPASVGLMWLYRLWMLCAREKASEVFDLYVADVSNYLDSAAGVKRELPTNEHVAGEIMRRFDHIGGLALKDGCESLVVVAHSLGSVIAYHALTGLAPEGATRDYTWLPYVRQLYTIGSPLQKISRMFPKLTSRTELFDGFQPALCDQLAWHNFHDRLDLVANGLDFAYPVVVRNHCTFFWGGGLALAHTTYRETSRFMAFVVKRLGLSPAEPNHSRGLFGRLVRYIGLLLALPAAALVGLVLIAVVGLLATVLPLFALVAISTIVLIKPSTNVLLLQHTIESGWLEKIATFADHLAKPAWMSVLFAVALGPMAFGRLAAEDRIKEFAAGPIASSLFTTLCALLVLIAIPLAFFASVLWAIYRTWSGG